MPYGTMLHEPPEFVFRVRVRRGAYLDTQQGEAWRDIAIAADQTMEELARYILDAFDFDTDHLASFYMSGNINDDDSEITVWDEVDGPFGLPQPLPLDDDPEPDDAWPRSAATITVGDVKLPGRGGKREFVLLFDFGDMWEFGIKLIERNSEINQHVVYPRVVASLGIGPDQYPALDDEDFDDDPSDESPASLLISFPTDRLNR